MLNYKPRLRAGTAVSSWDKSPEARNRGFIKKGGGYDISPFHLAGVAYVESDSHVRLMSYQGGNGAWMTMDRRIQEGYPLTIECDFNQTYNRGDPADGIVINLSQDTGATVYTGGVGGNIGFVTSTPTMGFVLDNWSNSGQPVPQFTVKDSRSGDAFRYTSPWVGLSWAEVTGRDTTKIELTYYGVRMWQNDVLKYDYEWSVIDGGRGMPAGPWALTISSATGASNQVSDVYSIKVNDSYWFYSGA